jgi:hypothetical protein
MLSPAWSPIHHFPLATETEVKACLEGVRLVEEWVCRLPDVLVWSLVVSLKRGIKHHVELSWSEGILQTACRLLLEDSSVMNKIFRSEKAWLSSVCK